MTTTPIITSTKTSYSSHHTLQSINMTIPSQPPSPPKHHNHYHNKPYYSPSLDEISPSCDNRFAESCFCLGVVDGGSHGTPGAKGGSKHVQELVEGDFGSSLLWFGGGERDNGKRLIRNEKWKLRSILAEKLGRERGKDY